MNLVGKIFTVFIFLMSVVFATFAVSVYTTHKNWMLYADNAKEPKGLYQKYEEEKATNKALTEKKNALDAERKAEMDRFTKRLQQLESENQILAKEQIKNEKSLAEKNQELRDSTGATKAAVEQANILRAAAAQLREDIKTAQADRDANFKRVVDLTDQLHNAVAERVRLETTSRNLADEFAKAKEALAYFKINYKIDYKAKSPPPDLQGEVTGLALPDLVEVSVGSDQGLRKQHQLEVVRMSGGPAVYVGRITVMESSPHRAVCRPDPRLLKSPIQKGDRVYANLSAIQ
jgi:hypothetical protein